ncbi:hypothetical protein FH972_022829 [Carpinus fangiana]|uniref:J domain-containing protein n=1 Tax=Carpinus fangiana TaxID=176857 RepID=A0A5N6KTR8_9ROSI|nr:hypothetical protein FH972_022829 [Carpinus fangiana]
MTNMGDPLPPDPYRALGVDRSATEDAIKKAYRKACLRCHPDKTKDPAKIEEFHNIQQAYDILGDEEKRHHYEATLRLQSLRKEMQGGRPSAYPSPRDAPPSSYDEKSRSRSGWVPGWSSRGPFRSEERVPPKPSEPAPQPRPAPQRSPTFEDDFIDRNELNRSASRKDDSYYSSTRRPAQAKPAKAESVRGSKMEKSSPKESREKERNEMKKQREREVQRERGRKYGPAPVTVESESSDDGHAARQAASRSQRTQYEEPRRRSDTTGARSAGVRESRRSDDEDSVYGRSRQHYTDQEEALRKYRIQSGDIPAPPPSYRAPPEADISYSRRGSSRDARPGLVRRSSTTKATLSKEPSSRPASRRASPVRRPSRTYESGEPTADARRPPGMPTSYSSPTGAGIKLPDERRGRSYDDYPRSRPSMRHADTMPSPRSSAERMEREERDKLYERADRSDREKSDKERSDRERSSGRTKLSRSDSIPVADRLERSSSGGGRTKSRRHYPEDATPAVSSGLRHGENNDSGYSTSSPSESPVEQFPTATAEPKKKVYQYASTTKADDPYVAEVRAPGGRRSSSPVREKKPSYPPSAAVHDRGRPPPSRSASYTTQPPAMPGLARRSSLSGRGETSSRSRSGIVRGDTMSSLPSRGRDRIIPPPLQTSYKVSDGRKGDGYFFGEQIRAASPDEMSPREPLFKVPAPDKVSYTKHYNPNDVAYAANSASSLGRRTSSARASYSPSERQERVMRPRREAVF